VKTKIAYFLTERLKKKALYLKGGKVFTIHHPFCKNAKTQNKILQNRENAEYYSVSSLFLRLKKIVSKKEKTKFSRFFEIIFCKIAKTQNIFFALFPHP